MQLRKQWLASVNLPATISLPSEAEWQLPEKVLQFGTGVLLRGLTDFYISKANRQRLFNGRIIVVKSTATGSADAFAKQDGLYTHCIKGIEAHEQVESYFINAAISRVLSAKTDWQKILECAANPALSIIISNTTEVGITLLETDSIKDHPPTSYPGKLLAFLYARYTAFNGSRDSGMVIIPTELIVENGAKLKDIVVQLAHLNKLEESFINWLQDANDFCSSLVDRIVPGALPFNEKQHLETTFGYTDDLAIMSEPYSLWAIETTRTRTKEILSFSQADKGVVITDDIYKYRELKLRLLNATHTLSCGLAYLCGFNIVNEALKDEVFHRFVSGVMYHETIPCITESRISAVEANNFAASVISRFSNPFIQHQWLSITLQYTGKIKTRCIPLILQHYNIRSHAPQHMALGFAAWLVFMRSTSVEGDKYYGERNSIKYWIQDDKASYFFDLWKENSAQQVLAKTLANTELWGDNLITLPGFEEAVLKYMDKILNGENLVAMLSSADANTL